MDRAITKSERLEWDNSLQKCMLLYLLAQFECEGYKHKFVQEEVNLLNE